MVHFSRCKEIVNEQIPLPSIQTNSLPIQTNQLLTTWLSNSNKHQKTKNNIPKTPPPKSHLNKQFPPFPIIHPLPETRSTTPDSKPWRNKAEPGRPNFICRRWKVVSRGSSWSWKFREGVRDMMTWMFCFFFLGWDLFSQLALNKNSAWENNLEKMAQMSW